MKEYKPAIYITGYKRHLSLERLLTSLNNAVYPHDVDLIISLDGGHTEEVDRIAQSFQFHGGTKTIIKHCENFGLRNHILWCGDNSFEHGSIIMLEDDLVVAPLFYIFAKQSLSFFCNEKIVAGISLYAQVFNEYSNIPFQPLHNDYDHYFMQVPSSWGQAWSSDQWGGFRKWYGDNKEKISIGTMVNIPDAIKKWPDSSWKKYFSAYLAQSNKFFIYPYRSLTSNCADPGGTHSAKGLKILQVPLYLNENMNHKFKFAKNTEYTANYDAFMEPICDFLINGEFISKWDLHVDINNTKSVSLLKGRKYAITAKSDGNEIAAIPLQFKPVEVNFQYYQRESQCQQCHLVESKWVREMSLLKRQQYRYSLVHYYENYTPGLKDLLYQLTFTLLERLKAIF